MELNNDNLEAEDVYTDSVVSRISNNQTFIEIEVGLWKKEIKLKLDSGAQVKILPLFVFQQLGVETALCPSDTKLSGYNNNPLKLLHTINLECYCAPTAQSGQVEFHVADMKSPPLLCLQSCIDFGLIKLAYAVELKTYPTCND